jgi:hypothetical protein
MCCASLPDRRHDLWKGTGMSSVLVEDIGNNMVTRPCYYRHLLARVNTMRSASALLRYWPYIWTLNGRAEDNVNSLGVDSQAISREGNGHPVVSFNFGSTFSPRGGAARSGCSFTVPYYVFLLGRWWLWWRILCTSSALETPLGEVLRPNLTTTVLCRNCVPNFYLPGSFYESRGPLGQTR